MVQLKRAKFINKDKTYFLKTLKERVDNYFIENNISKKGNNKMYIKSFFMIFLYILPILFVYIYQPTSYLFYLCYALAGFGVAGVGMNVMHDANHGAYSENKIINKLMGGTIMLLGGFDVNWKNQHNILHHTYTNITHLDEDISQRLKMRWSPHFKFHPVQQFQHIYAFLAYCLGTWSWTFIKDYKQIYTHWKNGVNKASKSEFRRDLIKLIIYKSSYYFVMLFVPIYFLNYSAGTIIGGYMLMHVVAGFTLSTVFQLAHVVEGVEFPMPDDNGNIENEWAIHQLKTTANFACNNKFMVWYCGGLTNQIEHHLMPDICHIHYPKISGIVKQTAAEFGIEYLESKTYFKALKSHYLMLKKFGAPSNFDLANA